MNNILLIDGIAAVVIILSAILAYSRGFVREFLAIFGWVGSALVAFIFAPQVEPLIKLLPVIGDFFANSCELGVLAAFAVVFAAALVIVSLFTPYLASVVRQSTLGRVDQGFGFLFGFARGVLLVAIVIFVSNTVLPNNDILAKSHAAEIYSQFSDQIEQSDTDVTLVWITRQYERMLRRCA
ncbi:MAG: CvpA family protein [Aestuariivita sp.]|nr:CvpA family protein [Aestuariivita sp.]MCY4202900.1 CvpA family protein [Aestuariivita sp.]MCY4289951.1 CvpA family protein [Aestuariivita sp.]MCY4346786.1 CvpA family protein [Aestuariivita sp.]